MVFHLFKNFPQFVVIHTFKGFGVVNKADVFLNSLAFLMIQRILAIWSLVPLPFLNPAWISRSFQFMYSWSLAWRILSITLLAFILNYSNNKLRASIQSKTISSVQIFAENRARDGQNKCWGYDRLVQLSRRRGRRLSMDSTVWWQCWLAKCNCVRGKWQNEENESHWQSKWAKEHLSIRIGLKTTVEWGKGLWYYVLPSCEG